MSEKLLRLPAVIDRVGLQRDTIYRMARAGTFPRPVKLSARASAWNEGQINDWIKARTESAHSDGR